MYICIYVYIHIYVVLHVLSVYLHFMIYAFKYVNLDIYAYMYILLLPRMVNCRCIKQQYNTQGSRW